MPRKAWGRTPERLLQTQLPWRRDTNASGCDHVIGFADQRNFFLVKNFWLQFFVFFFVSVPPGEKFTAN